VLFVVAELLARFRFRLTEIGRHLQQTDTFSGLWIHKKTTEKHNIFSACCQWRTFQVLFQEMSCTHQVPDNGNHRQVMLPFPGSLSQLQSSAHYIRGVQSTDNYERWIVKTNKDVRQDKPNRAQTGNGFHWQQSPKYETEIRIPIYSLTDFNTRYNSSCMVPERRARLVLGWMSVHGSQTPSRVRTILVCHLPSL